MDDTRNAPRGVVQSIEPMQEEVLLKKLGEHYYGIFLLRLLDGIIHNLNGPLQSLYIRSEQMEQNLNRLLGALESRELNQAEQLASRMADKAKGFYKNLDDLNAQLRQLSSDLVFQRHSKIEDVQVNEVIKACLFVLNADMFFKHQVTKTLKLNKDLPPVRARTTGLSIIVLNLVQNALEAMADAEDKHLVIETIAQDDEVVVRVQDSGQGIPEKDIQNIYKSFFTTRKTHGGQDEGEDHAGVGLSILSLFLKECRGTIACDSRPGKTTFTLQIPARPRTSRT